MPRRFSTILAATALLIAAGVVLIVVGMNGASPGGEPAYASDPGGTPIPLENPRTPRIDIVYAPGPLIMLLEEGGASQPSTIAESAMSTKSTTPHLRFGDEKQFMLGLMLASGRRAGVPEVSWTGRQRRGSDTGREFH